MFSFFGQGLGGQQNIPRQNRQIHFSRE